MTEILFRMVLRVSSRPLSIPCLRRLLAQRSDAIREVRRIARSFKPSANVHRTNEQVQQQSWPFAHFCLSTLMRMEPRTSVGSARPFLLLEHVSSSAGGR